MKKTFDKQGLFRHAAHTNSFNRLGIGLLVIGTWMPFAKFFPLG